jgi:hypothetical protein
VCTVRATDADPDAVVGKVAHIVAASPDGPRGDPSFGPQQLGEYRNLILLCSSHHDHVDVQPNTYTPNCLRRWKEEHENWVADRLGAEMSEVSYPELEVVTRFVVDQPPSPPARLSLTPLEAKLNKNQLGARTRALVLYGLQQANQVAEYVAHVAALDTGFPERLKSGFASKYERLLHDGAVGDELFGALSEFASGGSSDFRTQAAGLALLVYLLEKCEVFEV